ncbi:MAG: 50S ribosomal protein L6 [Candidatus Micrarchaeota archaeon]
MADKKVIEDTLAIPDGITLSISNEGAVLVSGKKGKVQKTIKLRGVKLSVAGKEVKASGAMRELNTAMAHIKNMIHGCKEGYVFHMTVVHAHFPMSVQAAGNQVSIKNFIGEKKPRFAQIAGDTKVEVKGASITVSGPSKEDVGQTVANLRRATKIRNLDSRIFQDGIYPARE